MRRILITGTNRGIGLELVRHYLLQDESLIFAACRNPSAASDLQAIAEQHTDRVHVVQLDVIDQASIEQALAVVSEQIDGLDLLINNAGILPGGVDARHQNIGTLGLLDADAMLDVFRVNTISPVIITQAFANLLRNGRNARVINVSSDSGSFSHRRDGGDYSYPTSKAALNMMSLCLAGDLRDDRVIVISVHPGFIKTDMGGANASLTLDEAVPGLVQTIDNLALDDTGQFFNWDGKSIEW